MMCMKPSTKFVKFMTSESEVGRVKYVFNRKKSSSLYPQLGEIYWMEGYDFHEASTYPDSKTVNKAT